MDGQVKEGRVFTEVDIDTELTATRAKQMGFLKRSFDTIGEFLACCMYVQPTYIWTN